MRLRGIDFGNVFIASGTLNFFGEGWRHHKALRMLPGFDFTGATFVSKTTTWPSREGNMKLRDDLQPMELFPDCIRVYPLENVVLNAVGLSGPGARALFWRYKWDLRKEPFLISFMAAGATREDRLREVQSFANDFAWISPGFMAPVGIELNISCPNIGRDKLLFILSEASDQLGILSDLDVPIVLKINALAPIERVEELAEKGLFDAVTVSNTIPWGALPERIDWKGIFGTDVSPLARYGGGGLSGAPLLPIVADWVYEASDKLSVPIIAGGGVLSKSGVDLLYDAGAHAIMIGSVAILRPWSVQGIIRHTNKVFESR